ncbi:MAG: pyridoxine 5'-phosphate synthase [Candidatus Omnitrophica bacterium]|nr:pyridoxine 5'-phosphate synthase [Candidatus Omnitrophota bacterium]
MPKLGVNIDHIATLRQARREFEPDPVLAAAICEEAGCDSIVAHLREDRRHINDSDIKRLRKSIKTRFNLEMSVNREIIAIACRIQPDQATLVPERREEITTEGGLDVIKNFDKVRDAVSKLQKSGIEVSLFIPADKKQIGAAKKTGAKIIEIHTGCYANAKTKKATEAELKKIKYACKYAQGLGITVNAGHGLKYDNTKEVAAIPGMYELNIGHSIISRAVFVGLPKAVKDMLKIIN